MAECANIIRVELLGGFVAALGDLPAVVLKAARDPWESRKGWWAGQAGLLPWSRKEVPSIGRPGGGLWLPRSAHRRPWPTGYSDLWLPARRPARPVFPVWAPRPHPRANACRSLRAWRAVASSKNQARRHRI